jgi:hypothetical protein
MSDIEILQGWGSFDAAVYKFAHECAEGERDVDGHLQSAGRKLWAYGYMPAFFRRLKWDVFDGIDVDEDSMQGEVERRFVRLFQRSWRAEIVNRILSYGEPVTIASTPRTSWNTSSTRLGE